jgi:hypothetical protein
MTPSEEYVKTLCEKTFLSLWCYANPIGKKNKELCDLLVVCDPSIIIISVKEIQYKDTDDFDTDYQRWRKKAIDNSVDQIYGAERWITTARNVTTVEGEQALIFPSKESARVYRVAVAFGSQGKASIQFSDFGKGFVHVFDEQSLNILMNELDTITDFIEYLDKKERLSISGKKLALDGGEEDLLAYFLSNNRSFPTEPDFIVFTNGIWDQFIKSKEYQTKKELNKRSYAWDALIEQLSTYFRENELLTTHPLDTFEFVIRIMAKEDRFCRRMLSEVLFEFLNKSKEGVSARIFPSPSGVTYLFQASNEDLDRKYRCMELELRCNLARGIVKENKIVVGIATERLRLGAGASWDVLYYRLDDWSVEAQQKFEQIQQMTGFFKNAIPRHYTAYEYKQ